MEKRFLFWLMFWSALVIASSQVCPRAAVRRQALIISATIALLGSLLTYFSWISYNPVMGVLPLLYKIWLLIALALSVQFVAVSQVSIKQLNDYILRDFLDRLRAILIFLSIVLTCWFYYSDFILLGFCAGINLGLLFFHKYFGEGNDRWMYQISNILLLAMVGFQLLYII